MNMHQVTLSYTIPPRLSAYPRLCRPKKIDICVIEKK